MSVDFTHGYLPPGVYIDENPSPLVVTIGLPPTRLAIIGRSAGYQSKSEQITLTATPVRLGVQGVSHASVKVTKVADGADVLGAQFTLTDTIPPAGGDVQNYYTDIALSGTATVLTGTAVWVTYAYVVPGYFTPTAFRNFEDVKALFGNPLNLTPQGLGDTTYQPINSPLSLAAQLAIQNGAGEIVLCPIPTTLTSTSTQIRAAIVAAYALISADYTISLVVPLTDGISAVADCKGVGTELKAHLDATSADGYFRTGILGFPLEVTTAPDTLVTTGGYQSKRIMQAFANTGGMQMFNGGANQTVVVGHQYLAAAYGGTLSYLPVQKSLTHEHINGFSGIAGTPLANTTRNQYSAAGVALTEINRNGQIVVRHGTTTDRTNINTSELSVVRGRDAMVYLVQSGTEQAGLIGQPIDENTSLSVKSVVAGLLEYLVAISVIVSYTGLQVRQNITNPSIIEVKYAYRPAYPLNYILISFSIDVTTGATDLTATTA